MVLKPAADLRAASWTAELFARLKGSGFRVPRPRRAVDGSWLAEEWAAWEWVEGEPAPVERWPELVVASRALHAALAGVPRPSWLGRRRDRWAVADRVAWGAASVMVAPELQRQADALLAALRPVGQPSQLVHGDIAGNVLFAEHQAPAVIDLSPFWRPAGYALAIAAVDVLVWSGAPPTILGALEDQRHIDQLLLRALLFRRVTESLGRLDHDRGEAVRSANEPVVDLVLARVSGSAPPAAF